MSKKSGDHRAFKIAKSWRPLGEVVALAKSAICAKSSSVRALDE